MDFAGGLVVHATAGVSALVIAVMVGRRRGFPNALHPPHSPGLTLIGARLLWVGWFGFNGGSALAADGGAAMAIVVTHLSAAAASLTWAGLEWLRFGKPSLVGLVTRTIADLASVTPASGFIGPVGGVLIGIARGAVCFYAVALINFRLKIDNSLDVFAVHGSAAFSAPWASPFWPCRPSVVWAWPRGSARAMVGQRLNPEDDIESLDVTAHGERSYML